MAVERTARVERVADVHPSARSLAAQLAWVAAFPALIGCLPWMLRDFSDYGLHLTPWGRARMCLCVILGPLSLVPWSGPLNGVVILSSVIAVWFAVFRWRRFFLVRCAAFVIAVCWPLFGAVISSLAV